MPLQPGTRLGPYEITAAIGAGGMGEVYRARDAKLNRDVAIKVLPEAFATDAERLARFTREAQTLAALNHPNIAQIYGVEEHAIVMELVEGEDLSARISHGAMSMDDALPIASQIIDALEAAHEIGIVHRDLKPANIKVREDGTVKVLDFGLAKALDPDASKATADTADSPTLTARATLIGMIIGTAAYMSPEQARGRAVDKRTDVWAFGCVLFEMLTGTKAFDGEDATEIISGVVKSEPDWDALPASVPSHVRTVVTKCLVKNRKARVPDLVVVRYMLDGTIPAGEPSEAVTAPPQRSTRIWQAATAAFVLTTLAAGVAWYRAQAVVPDVMRFFVTAPDGTEFAAGRGVNTNVVISPDGQTLAFTAVDDAGTRKLWLRPVDSLTAHSLDGTEGATYPFWSPDSQSIGYSTVGTLMKVSASGGPSQPICGLGPRITSRGGAWSRDGVIIFNNGRSPLHRCSSAGGEAAPVGQLAGGQIAQAFPSFLPDGRHFLYHSSGVESARGGRPTAVAGVIQENADGIYIGSLDSDEATHVVRASSGGIYDPSSGHLLFVVDGTLVAQEFDVNTFTLVGVPVPIAGQVDFAGVPGFTAFSLSDTGVLAYGIGRAGAMGNEMVWLDRQGEEIGTVESRGEHVGLDLSPNGSQVAAHLHTGDGGDVYLTDLMRGTTTRFTFDATQHNSSPVWSPSGTQIAFGSIRSGKAGVYVRRSNGTGDDELVFETEVTNTNHAPMPFSWSPDESQILIEMSADGNSRDLWLLPLSGDRAPEPLMRTPFSERHGQISPDGKWLAYDSNETGQTQIYVQAVSAGVEKWPVSTGGGTLPRWRGDSRELFYVSPSTATMVAVAVGADGRPGTSEALFDTRSLVRFGHSSGFLPFAVSQDGQRFLMARRPGDSMGDEAERPIVVVLNWADGMGR